MKSNSYKVSSHVKPNIIFDVATQGTRYEEIRVLVDLIRPLQAKKNKASQFRVTPISSRNEVIYAVSDIDVSKQRDYTSWRFKTFIDNIEASYFEKWIHFEKDLYYLDRIYFHLYKINPDARESKEYVLLHCEPNFNWNGTTKDEQDKYQHSPHIHLKSAEEPLPHSHFSLNLLELPKILSSIKELNSAIENGILLIKEQVLDYHLTKKVAS